MEIDYNTIGAWGESFQDYMTCLKATVKPATRKYHFYNSMQLIRWCMDNRVKPEQFETRHMRQYVAHRVDNGNSERTRRHAVVAARLYFEFCAKEGYVTANPLAGYKIPRAARAYVKMPSTEDLQAVLKALNDQWDPKINPGARYFPPRTRKFYQKRNYAIVSGLIETGCRVGEILALKVEDFHPDQVQIAITQSKTDLPRIVPISQQWIGLVREWLRIRKSPTEWLFTDIFGERIEVDQFGQQFRGYVKKAGVTASLHSIRHYSITQTAKIDVWAAAQKAGHVNLETTRAYLHGDPDHVRAVSARANVLGNMLGRAEAKQPKRKRLV